MKIEEWKKLNNLKTEKDIQQYFRNNMLQNKIPVALYSCICCGEILENSLHKCPICNILEKDK